jgi:hypothetical protein
MHILRFAPLVAVGLALVYGLGAGSAAESGQSLVISALTCSGDPETVTIRNDSANVQSLSGWKLQSDPVDQQTFDLTPVGTLLPSGTISIASGPSAQAVFTWSHEFMFRDGDPTDFARLVDPVGNILSPVPCAPALQPAESPSPSPAPAPAPAPNAAPPGSEDLPNGGGPPGVEHDTDLLTLVLPGGALTLVGLLLVAVSILLTSAWRPAALPALAGETPSAARAISRRPASAASGSQLSLLAYLLAGVVVLAFLLRARSR